MVKINGLDNQYSVFAKPGDYNKVLDEKYDVLIENNNNFASLIEIIIPTFNRPKLLIEALKSALNQTVDLNYLITIIDNNPSSSLEVNEIFLKFKSRVRYIRNKNNLGLFGNWNRALHISKAPFIALLHDDDLLEPNYLYHLNNLIKLFPDVGVVTHTPFELIKGEKINPNRGFGNMVKKGTARNLGWKEFLYANKSHASCMLINVEKAKSIGGWSSLEYPSADWFFNARMAFNYSVFKFYMPLSIYRWEVNTSLNSGMKDRFFYADLFFLINNLKLYSKSLSTLQQLRIISAISDRFEELDLKGTSAKNKWITKSYDELVIRLRVLNPILSTFYLFIMKFLNRYEDSILWLFTRKRII